eukprot:GFKZ01013808.1.p1 GENE.GFKZ01013808.1~~GFKZ01013808.1.p1  ORF type:complete len:533 (-),score=45.74 GFKZ01013808.1:762-2360(-)
MPLVRSSSFSSGARLRSKLSFRRSNSFHRTQSFRKSLFDFASNPSQNSRRWRRSKKSNIPRAQWLDVLPLEVCERIATYVSNGALTLDLLHLAQSSAKQGTAVIKSLNYKLAFGSSCPTRVMTSFVDLFKDNAVETNIADVKSRNVSRVLEGRMLSVASISDCRSHLYAATVIMQIRDLHLKIEAVVPRKLVLRALACLPLSRLSIVCHHDRSSRCPFLEPIPFAHACPDIISLSAKCRCHPRDPAPWRVMPHLHQVKEVEIFDDLPKQWFPRVSTFESVKVFGRNAYITAATLGHSVTELNLLEGPNALTRNQLALLRRCRLTVLRARLAAHAEASLPHFCRETPNLRVLELQWRHSRETRSRCPFYGVRFAQMAKGVLLRSVKMLPVLCELKLLSVQLQMSELTAALRFMGPRLRFFGTSIANQLEEPFDRLWSIVETTSVYNADLKEFYVSESAPMFPFGSFVLVGRLETLKAMAVKGAMLAAAVRKLKKRAPALGSKSLDSITRILVNERYHLIADIDQVRVDPVTRW